MKGAEPHRQAGFGGGEIAEALYGRTDVPSYRASLKRCRNFLPTAEGRLFNRPGTQYVGRITGTYGAAKLYPFIFGGDQNCVLIFDPYYGSNGTTVVIRFVRKGKYIVATGAAAFSASALEGSVVSSSATGGHLVRAISTTTLNPNTAAPYAGGTTFALNDLAYVAGQGIYQSIQAANTGHTPSASPTWWTRLYEELPRGTDGVDGVDVPNDAYQVTSPYSLADLATLRCTQSGDTVVITCLNQPPRELKRYSDTRWTLTSYATLPSLIAPSALAISGSAPTADATHPVKPWSIWVTAYTDTDAGLVETLVSNTLTPGGGLAVYPDKPAAYGWVAPVVPPTGYFIYRGQGGVGGLIGTSKTTTFTDEGKDPNYARQPPSGRNPFDTSPSTDAGRNPQVAAFHGQRLFFGNSYNLPATIWGTRLAQLHSFDRVQPANVDDAIDCTLSVTKYEEIRWMISRGSSLLLGTSGAERVLSGVQGEQPNPQSLDDQCLSEWGSSWVVPTVIGTDVLFVSVDLNDVREFPMARQFGTDRLPGRSLTLQARDFFSGYTLLDAAYTRTPLQTYWVVRSDGVLLSLSYVPEISQAGWARHDFASGLVESICSIPEGRGHALYLTLNRNGIRTLERMSSRKTGDRQAFATTYADTYDLVRPEAWIFQPVDPAVGIFLDCSLSWDGSAILPDWKISVNGGPGAVTVTATFDLFDANWIGSVIVLANGVTLTITAFTDTKHVTATASAATGAVTASTSYTLKRKKIRVGAQPFTAATITTVTTVADGVVADLPIVAGYVTLAAPSTKITAGIRQTQQMGLLPLGGARSDLKNAGTAFLELVSSDPTGLSVGGSYTDLTTWKPEAGQVIDPTTGLLDSVKLAVPSTWTRQGEVVIQQTDPRPIEIVGATREVHG